MKVVIIGDAFVGKTTFIRRYMERTFSENLGVSFYVSSKHGNFIKFNALTLNRNKKLL